MTPDAILIPGGGVRDGGELPPWVRARFDLALKHWTGQYLLPLSAGTTYRPPPLDARGFPITEAEAGAWYLLSRGVPAEKILIEACSYDTIGNAFFSRVLHAAPRGLRSLLVVTSAFHLPRSEAVFRWVYGLDGPPGPVTLDFAAAPDTGINAEARTARIEKERAGLARIPALAERLNTLEKLHTWIFSEHDAYRAGGESSPTALAETY